MSHPKTEAIRQLLAAGLTSTDAGLDLIAIERVINNSRPLPALTEPEQRLAVDLLHEAGVPYDEIASRTAVREHTVTKWIAAANPKPKREMKGCPSRAAYHRHKARGETCEPCKAANAEYDRRYRLMGATSAAA